MKKNKDNLLSMRYVGEALNFPTFVFILLLIFFTNKANAEDYKIPDFAFPITVEEHSSLALSQALETGDEIMALRSMMNMIIANNLEKGLNVASENVNLIDSVSQQLKGYTKRLSFLLEAGILRNIYLENRGTYDSRKLPLDMPFPDDPELWSSEMFASKILELVDKATYNIEFTTEESIENYALILTDLSGAKEIGFTLKEFIVFKSESILRTLQVADSNSIIPFFEQQESKTPQSIAKQKGKELLNLISQHLASDNPVVKALAIRDELWYVADEKKEKFLEDSLKILKGTEGEGLILYELSNNYNNQGELYSQIKEWLEKFPSGFYYGQLTDVLSLIEEQNVEAVFPKLALSDSIIKGEVKVKNSEKAYILVYKLKESQINIYDGPIYKNIGNLGAPISMIEVSGTGEIPFTFQKEVELPPLSSGLYLLIPSDKPRLKKSRLKDLSSESYSTIRISNLSIVSSMNSNEINSGRIYIVKGCDQAPVEGALVEWFSSDSNIPSGKSLTNKEGYVNVPPGYFRIVATKGRDIAKTEAGFSYYPVNHRNSCNASILTDLSVYRPGDTVRFEVIGWMNGENSNSLLKGNRVEVVLKDPNYQNCGNTLLELDSCGRTTGEFLIPKGRLLGNYQLIASYPDFNSWGGAVSISVEEYKLPSFTVVLSQEKENENDDLVFHGFAQTFSGMPVTDAEVNIKIEYIPWRWGLPRSSGSFTTHLTTDSDGEFNLELPLKNLKNTIYEKGRFSINAEVTSQSGETNYSSPLFFYLGNQNEIRPSVADKIKISGDTLVLDIPVYDMTGLPIKTKVNFSRINLQSPEDTIKGSFISPLFEIPTESLESGKYKFIFSTDDSEENPSIETVFWRDNDLKVPYPTSLWIPENQYVYTSNTKEVEILCGDYWEGWILYVLSDGEQTLSQGWWAPESGMQCHKIPITDDRKTLFLSLAAMNNLKQETGIITLVPYESLRKMEITTETFRDKVSAGDEETWKFRYKIDGENASDVHVMAVMTDKALNSIRDFKWALNMWRPDVYNKVRINGLRVLEGRSWSLLNERKMAHYKPVQWMPDWQTYGYSLTSAFMRGPVMYKMTARNLYADAAAGMVEEMADDSMEIPQTESVNNNGKEELRPVEMPVAFFMPYLNTNEEGEVVLNFKVPNYNTTWQLQIAGYNDELLSATKILDIIASKKVMVKTNLPRFLRTGDKVQIEANIYNNSEETLQLGGKIELVDAVSGEIIGQKEFNTTEVSPSGNRIISINLNVDDKLEGIIVRAYGYSDNNFDGEQGLIEILPSSTPVIESTNFYAGTDQNVVEIKIPSMKKGSNVTLKYCDNPLWEVLMALPGYIENTDNSSLSLSRWLYGTLTSLSIIDNHPEISSGLSRILEDSLFSQSNLQKDNNLKLMALEATPWINDAFRQTAEIRSLGKYLDQENIRAQVEFKVNRLKSLQSAEGGWTWFEGMKSSPYITGEILGVLAYIHELGEISPDIEIMSRKAIKYYDGWLISQSEKNIKPNFLNLMKYIYNREKFEVSMVPAMKRIEKETIDSIVSGWRYFSPGQKAMAGMILSKRSGYEEVSYQIAASLKQFVSGNLQPYQLAMILEFFDCAQVGEEWLDKIREALLLKKETADWNNYSSKPAIINSLIRSYPDLPVDREMPEIYIGNERFTPDGLQSLPGSITIDLDARKVSGKTMRIIRKEGIPAWGGVISQYVAPIKDVKSQNIPDLQIEKKIYKISDEGKAVGVKTYFKGDKVEITLTLNVGKDMDYIAITDSRSACLVPTDFTSGMTVVDGLWLYKETGKEKTSFFIENLPAGKYIITYECDVDRNGEYTTGIAEVQSLYMPTKVAHTGGSLIKVDP